MVTVMVALIFFNNYKKKNNFRKLLFRNIGSRTMLIGGLFPANNPLTTFILGTSYIGSETHLLLGDTSEN